MSNVDGLYATTDIDTETILFREDTMPDCTLHRSNINPNCKVVQVLDEETGTELCAVISSRKIIAGEFFCIPESDTESDEEEGEEERGEWLLKECVLSFLSQCRLLHTNEVLTEEVSFFLPSLLLSPSFTLITMINICSIIAGLSPHPPLPFLSLFFSFCI